MSPSEAKAKHSATDLIRWAQRFEDELNEFHREDYGVARVAYEVYELRATLSAIFGSKLPSVKTEDFITKFTASVPEVPLAEMSDEDREARIKKISEDSRAVWFAGLGLGPDGKPARQTDPAEHVLAARESPVKVLEGQQSANTPPKQKIRRIIKPGGTP